MGCHVEWELVPLEPELPKQVSSKRVLLEQVLLGESIPDELHVLGVQSAKLHLAEWQLTISGKAPLRGAEFDLNDTPDLLPPLAAVACFARGDTALVNVASARIKETDRINLMSKELGKLGVKITEKQDGLIVHGTGGVPQPTTPLLKTNGYNDHRVVMALACAALGCNSPVEISGAESAANTYPGFWELLGTQLGN
jgi:3-phosphoshikimate 1-carboxyvinyltransferase